MKSFLVKNWEEIENFLGELDDSTTFIIDATLFSAKENKITGVSFTKVQVNDSRPISEILEDSHNEPYTKSESKDK